MSNDKQLLKYLQRIENKLDKRFSELDSRIFKLEGKTRTNDINISRIMNILQDITQDPDSVYFQDDNTFILNREKVYSEFDRHDLDRQKALRELYSAGHLKRDTSRHNTRLTKRPDGKVKRAVVIQINI
ncbi:hypothetical protein [Dehalobacter sp.]|uniref:hypothetical protein n=1 Tax=Dehalobacter sp. TaxID=1962289 RepID=UPI00258B0CCA|nr:hypothetical protein [Dehalobacter sp.]MDJ0305368.1 hypothetical protein [Dehalobacter sp.]